MARNVTTDARGAMPAGAAVPDLLTSAQLAACLGVALRTLQDWRREKSPEGQRLRSCIHRATARSTYYSTTKLRACGLLAAATPVARSATDPAAEVIAWRIGGGL